LVLQREWKKSGGIRSLKVKRVERRDVAQASARLPGPRRVTNLGLRLPRIYGRFRKVLVVLCSSCPLEERQRGHTEIMR
jgi:hypothetical protein